MRVFPQNCNAASYNFFLNIQYLNYSLVFNLNENLPYGTESYKVCVHSSKFD